MSHQLSFGEWILSDLALPTYPMIDLGHLWFASATSVKLHNLLKLAQQTIDILRGG